MGLICSKSGMEKVKEPFSILIRDKSLGRYGTSQNYSGIMELFSRQDCIIGPICNKSGIEWNLGALW